MREANVAAIPPCRFITLLGEDMDKTALGMPPVLGKQPTFVNVSSGFPAK